MSKKINKEDYKKGMKVYLLCISNENRAKYNKVSAGTVTTIGDRYISVDHCGEILRFEFDEKKEQIVYADKYGQKYELYLSKKDVGNAARKTKLIKDSSALIELIVPYNKLDKFSVRDLEIIKSFAMILIFEKNFDNISGLLLDKLPEDIKDGFYRKIWAEHVYEDIRSMEMKVSKKRAEKVSEAYVNGRYDCNLSYWDNLNNLFEEIPEEQTKQECFSLHECLTKRLQTEVSAIHRCSAIDIDFINNNGIKDETQIHVFQNILTKAGTKEAEELFRSLKKELETNRNRIISCTVVASAETEDELDKLLD